MEYQPESIELLTIDPHTYEFKITQKGKQFLQSLNRPISVITIAGMYRTGKSYLVNKLINRKRNQPNQRGFKIGSTTQSVTKGLNIWGQPIPAQTQTGQQIYYLLIDSQGLGSLQQQIQYDLKLLLLIFLCSSTVVYNSLGAIDQQALDQLRVILNLKKCLGDAQQIKPRFIWVLRDFALQLIDKNGYQMTSNQYLENCLEQTNAINLQAKKKNQIRRAIKQNLPRRECYTLVRPTLQEQDLAQLSMNKSKIRPQFLTQIQHLKQSLISGTSRDIKTIKGKQLDGKLFSKILEEYISKINSNQTPSVSNIWQAVITLNNKQRLQQVCDKMKADVKKIQLPLSKQQLQRKLNQIQNKAYNAYSSFLKMDQNTMKNHKEFINFAQKINKDVKDTNRILYNRNIKNEMMKIVQQSISFEKIKPTQLLSYRTVLQRLDFKAKSSPQCYDYIFQVVYDIFHISQQKSLSLQRQMIQVKKSLQNNLLDKKQTEVSLMALKHDYHQSLKQINQLKNLQMQFNKQKAMLIGQIQDYKNKIRSMEYQKDRKRQDHLKNIQQSQNKSKNKFQELNYSLKKLRQEKNDLQSQIDSLKKQLLSSKEYQDKNNDRKQFIFEQKMKQAWQKIQNERKQYIQKTNDFSKQLKILKEQNFQLRENLKKQKSQREQQKLNYISKQIQFQRQYNQLKETIKNTKKSYEMTYQTMMNNQKVFKNIQNLTSKKKNINDCNIQKDSSQYIKNYYQRQIQRQKQSYQQQIQNIKNNLKKIEFQYKQENLKCMNYQLQIKDLKQRNNNLQNDIYEANKKFNECISQIDQAKQKQRSLYEESILRLLNNMQKNENNSIHHQQNEPQQKIGRQSIYSSKSSYLGKHY